MKRTTKFLLLLHASFLCYFTHAQNETFSRRVVNASYNLNSAWEITYGPNDSLWVTENKAYLVSRINIANGSKTVLLDLLGTAGDAQINFSENGSTGKKNTIRRIKPAIWPQGGLMGLAIHPALYSSDPLVRRSKPWVYLAYVFSYVNTTSCSGSSPCYFYSRIVRYNYSGNTLTNATIILDSIPGSNDHNSGRLKIGPDLKLYYTVGDMGAGQFNNTSRSNHALNIESMEGKVLRLNTEPEVVPASKLSWIPADNPFYDGAPITPKDFVYSFGHRNAQGIDWVTINGTDLLFSSEHGDKSDDEVNIIKKGNSYGWNRVSGYCDDNYNGLSLGGYSPVNEAQYCSTATNNAEPIFTTFTASREEISRFTGDMFTFKTIAPSSIEVYKSSTIPGWQNSVLVPALKGGRVYRMKLDASGASVVPLSNGVDTAAYFAGQGRFRDLAISPNGLKIYLACDLSGATSGPTGGFNNKINTTSPPNAGKIIEFTYTGPVTPASRMAPSLNPVEQTALFNIYPNPARDRVTIATSGQAGLYNIEIFDLNGRRMKSTRTAKGTMDIDLKGMSRGVYTIRVTDEHRRVFLLQKIIKQ